MPSSPEPEVPYYRGKTLTPESPRPVHIPEPSNIPVLDRQIDPIFNLMSTHMEHPHALRDLTAMDHAMAHSLSTNQSTPNSAMNGTGDDLLFDARLQDGNNGGNDHEINGLSVGNEIFKVDQGLEQTESSLNQIQKSFLADQHSPSMASYENLHTPTGLEPNPPSLSFSKDSSQHPTEPHDPSQATPSNRQTSSPTDANQDYSDMGDGNNGEVSNGGVNFQALLDNLPSSSVATLQTTNVSSATPASPRDTADVPPPSSANLPSTAMPAAAGLPPRPPPQEKPAIHPNYVPGEDIRSYHYPQMHHPSAHTNLSSQPSNSYRPPQSFVHPIIGSGAPGTASANGLPPPPMATFQQPPPRPQDQLQRSPGNQQFNQKDMPGRTGNRGVEATDGDPSWSSEVQKKYDQFLGDERVYTAEGTWDKFPQGSRLFVGNLPSEVVNKRDIFQIFHKYGRLAQISIKQAYGFVQFLDANACLGALHAEQGVRIKERNMHLEISKPQKNARNAASTAAGDNLRASHYRRSSRSPNHGRRPSSHGMGQRTADRFVPFSDFRDDPRRRDDYRPGRSPSPRNFRGRDDYRSGRDRSPDRYYGSRRSRSRSPQQYSRAPIRYRSPSPRRPVLDEDAALPIPRRDPRDVPDVQLILVEELDKAFVAYIEKTFIDRGLRCGVLILPRVSLDVVVNRQILEGVQAVIKLYRSAQATGKIPLQLFDRTGGVDNIRFEEYDELEARVAAELVIRAKTTQAALQIPSQSQYPGAPRGYGQPQYPHPGHQAHPQTQHPGPQPNIANLITSLDGPALQQLLGAMQQNPQTPVTPQQHTSMQAAPPQQPSHQDLAALLGNVNRGQQPGPQHQASNPQGYPSYPPQQSQQPQQPTPQQQFPYGAPYQGSPQGQQQYQQQQQQASHPQQSQQHVQNIMEQLAKFGREL